jgi:hypothetical protein
LAFGKKRANRSAHPCSFAVRVTSSDRLKSPLNWLSLRDRAPLRPGTPASADGHNVPAIEMHAARQRRGNAGGLDIEQTERLRNFP